MEEQLIEIAKDIETVKVLVMVIFFMICGMFGFVIAK